MNQFADQQASYPAPAIPPGMSRREYWKQYAERNHPQETASHEQPDSVPSFENNENFEPAPPEPGAAQAPAAALPPRKRRLSLKLGPPFWTITGLFSLAVNVILLVVVITLASQIFSLKSTVQDQLLGGLYNNFVLMDQSHIRTTIPISASVPAKFDLVINTETTVVLKKATLVKGANLASLVSGGVSIYNAPIDIVLPAGTELPISFSITVPVDQQIPVNLNVNVDIPLNQTDLHTPFVGLQNVVSPYYQLLKSSPNSLKDTLCGTQGSDLCLSIVP